MQLEYIMKLQQLVETAKFTQSQAHGLFWDSEIRVKVFHLPECINDTRKYDIECSENEYNRDENVSIKSTCSDTIDCGDILRFFDQFEAAQYTIIVTITNPGINYTYNNIPLVTLSLPTPIDSAVIDCINNNNNII